MGKIREILNRILLKKKWRKLNLHNSTEIIGECNLSLISVGRYTYGGIHALTFNDKDRLVIGDFCSIAPEVTFIVSADHALYSFSTFPMRVKVLGENELEGKGKGDIVVEDDVWIGYGATIISGVHISQGAVIAAGAIACDDVPAYAVVGGAPARIIKYRFSKDVINKMLRIDFGMLTSEIIREHIEDFDRALDIGRTFSLPNWIPVKKEKLYE